MTATSSSPEPTFPDDSPEGISEQCWQLVENKMKEQTTSKHFTCPVCGSEETVVVTSMLRRESKSLYPGTKSEQTIPRMRRDLICQCNHLSCPENHGTQHFQWIEEVPEHEK